MGRKAIKGVLHNFTETYTSRYSDYGGYWLFGVLISEVDRLNINLLDTVYDASEKTPASAAVQLAAAEFRDQIEKARVSLSWIREARLAVAKSPDARDGFVNGHRSAGFDVSVVTRVVMDSGKTYEHQKKLFVAPHDPQVEQRSTRGP